MIVQYQSKKAFCTICSRSNFNTATLILQYKTISFLLSKLFDFIHSFIMAYNNSDRIHFHHDCL